MITKSQEFEALGIRAKLYQVVEGTGGAGGLYISNYFSAMNLPLLEKHNIKSILTIAKGCFLTYTKDQIPNYLYISIEDKSSADIAQYFDKCFTFIDSSRSQSNVLVHCKAGVSRSATIIIAYLMSRFKYSLSEAYQVLKRANPRIRPNCGFAKKLQELYFQLTGEHDFILQRPRSAKQSVITNPSNCQQTPLLTKRQRSLSKMAKDLDIQNKHIQDRIVKIKGLIYDEADRKRSNSEYLNRRLSQMKQKKLGQKFTNFNKQQINRLIEQKLV